MFRSIDDFYIGPWRGSATGRVTLEHVPGRPTEIRVGQGDVVRFLNNWDEYAGIGTKQNHSGLIPMFKIESVFKMHNYSSNINI